MHLEQDKRFELSIYTLARYHHAPPNPNRTCPTPWADAPKKKARYGDIAGFLIWWPGTESNHRHADFQDKVRTHFCRP